MSMQTLERRYEKALAENKIYKKAIQQYLDCQTTNQWVDHFRKALKEATKQGGSVA